MSQKTHPQCTACRDGVEVPFPFTMAFQPIVDVDARLVFAYEALVRGPHGEGAGSVLGKVTEANRYSFDQSCRVKAITLAHQLGLAETGARLSINFIPGAVYAPASCIQLTLRTANQVGFPCDRLIFEIVEQEEVVDRNHLMGIVAEYQRHGFSMAIDDFGAGHSGLSLLADFPTDVLKLDMEMTRNLDQRPRAREIVRQVVSLAERLKTVVVAEGIETLGEYDAVRDCGISLIQGYLLARPGFECLPEVHFPRDYDAASEAAREEAFELQLV